MRVNSSRSGVALSHFTEIMDVPVTSTPHQGITISINCYLITIYLYKDWFKFVNIVY